MPQPTRTPEEIGKTLAATIHAFHAEVIRKGLTPQLANSLAEKVASAAISIDGNCGEMPRAGQPGPL
jgi:predicted Zn-dependent protease